MIKLFLLFCFIITLICITPIIQSEDTGNSNIDDIGFKTLDDDKILLFVDSMFDQLKEKSHSLIKYKKQLNEEISNLVHSNDNSEDLHSNTNINKIFSLLKVKDILEYIDSNLNSQNQKDNKENKSSILNDLFTNVKEALKKSESLLSKTYNDNFIDSINWSSIRSDKNVNSRLKNSFDVLNSLKKFGKNIENIVTFKKSISEEVVDQLKIELSPCKQAEPFENGLFNVSQIIMSPSVIKRGTQCLIKIRGTYKEDKQLTKGYIISKTYMLDKYLILSEKIPICVLNGGDYICPFENGLLKIDITKEVPTFVKPGLYKIENHVYSSKNKKLGCVSFQLKIDS